MLLTFKTVTTKTFSVCLQYTWYSCNIIYILFSYAAPDASVFSKEEKRIGFPEMCTTRTHSVMTAVTFWQPCVVHRRPHAVQTITLSRRLISCRYIPETVTTICSYQDGSTSAQPLGSGMEDPGFDSNLVHGFCLYSTPALGSIQPNAFVPDTVSPMSETRRSLLTGAKDKNPWSFASTWPCVFCSIPLHFYLSQ
jgi:hypothetical protein